MTGTPVVVLAGGRATRMGGLDKALLTLGDRTLLDHVLARLAGQGGDRAINANGDATRFLRFSLPVLPDPVAGWPGPLAGVLAAMRWATMTGADAVVTVPADTPFLPLDLVVRLQAARHASGAAIACAATAGRIHPVAALWPVYLADALAAFLQASAPRSVQSWAAVHGLVTADFSAARCDPFFNVNTSVDAERAAALLGDPAALDNPRQTAPAFRLR